MFHDRKDAATQLVARLKGRNFQYPVVLGVPRGGMIPASIIAHELNAELDVLLARKLRASFQPELAIGAISEDGEVYLYQPEMVDKEYLEKEKAHQLAEIKRRRSLIRNVLEPVSLEGRSVIITDDGIATGSTIMAGLHAIRCKKPFEVVVAIPIAPPETLKQIKNECDEAICLHSPKSFWSIGQFYRDFAQVTDEEMIELLSDFSNKDRHTA